jgi:asparagine synthetase B (glutamine-hydrolysing)
VNQVGCCRLVYNLCLDQKVLERERSRPRKLSQFDQIKELTALKAEFDFLREVAILDGIVALEVHPVDHRVFLDLDNQVVATPENLNVREEAGLEQRVWCLPREPGAGDNRGGLRQVQDERALIEEYQFLMEDAVRIQMRSDVPVGCFVSGGIDSTVVAVGELRHQ